MPTAFDPFAPLKWLEFRHIPAEIAEDRLQEFAYRTLFALGLVVVPAIGQFRRPERNVAAQQQLIVTATAHMIGTFIAAYVDPLAYVLVAVALSRVTGLRFEWDPRKASANLQKHGVTFEEAQTVFLDEDALLIPDAAHSQEEERFILLGMSLQLRALVVVHC